jgi:hypothetical protein
VTSVRQELRLAIYSVNSEVYFYSFLLPNGIRLKGKE